MTIRSVLIRFLIIYTLLLIFAGLLVNYFEIEDKSGINGAILAACTFMVCGFFVDSNNRFFSKYEVVLVILGLIAIDLVLQIIFGAASLAKSQDGVKTDALLYGVAIVGLLHAIAITFFVLISKKVFIRQGAING